MDRGCAEPVYVGIGIGVHDGASVTASVKGTIEILIFWGSVLPASEKVVDEGTGGLLERIHLGAAIEPELSSTRATSM